MSIQMNVIRSIIQDGQCAWYYSRLISETSTQKFTPIFPLSASCTSLHWTFYDRFLRWEIMEQLQWTRDMSRWGRTAAICLLFISLLSLNSKLVKSEARNSLTVPQPHHHTFLDVQKKPLYIVAENKVILQDFGSL